MGKGKSRLGILLVLTLLVGGIAPLPECFVTDLLCPLGKILTRQEHPARAACQASAQASCCAKAGAGPPADSIGVLAQPRRWMQPYVPSVEIVAAPTAPMVLALAPFFKDVLPGSAVFVPRIEQRSNLPDPIPILLHKQSFLM